MPSNDLLSILQQGQVRVGDHLIDIALTDNGRHTYAINHIEGDQLATAKDEHGAFQDALMHALGHMIHELREHADGDDSIEGPAADHEAATNLLQLMCAARDLAPRDFIPNGAAGATLAQLHDALGAMLDEGIDPDTPIRMRTLPREPNLIADPPAAPLVDVWHDAGEQIIYLDEPET